MIAQTLIFAVLLLIMWTIVILLVWHDGREKKKGTAMKDNDLISRSALLEKAEGGTVCWFDIKHAPAVDAVEVVRCKDCKHGEIDDPDFPYQYYCQMGHMWNDERHFCADGERRTDDATD